MNPWIVLGMYGLALIVVFGVRSWVQWRRTGRTGFHGISGRPLSAEWWGGVLFVLALVAGALAPVAGARDVFVTLALPPWTLGVGLIAFLVGFGGTFAAQTGMGTSWRIGVDPTERTALVRTGMFAWVRNPIFSFMLLGSFGLALLVPNVLGWAALAALLVAVELQVRFVEEPYLRRAHGVAYSDYEASVGRFVPGIGLKRQS